MILTILQLTSGWTMTVHHFQHRLRLIRLSCHHCSNRGRLRLKRHHFRHHRQTHPETDENERENERDFHVISYGFVLRSFFLFCIHTRKLKLTSSSSLLFSSSELISICFFLCCLALYDSISIPR